ncbi:MAG: RluA family pseudouridine synthase [Myxococcales bacterium]|jgi:23S rRNA pseudouridine1911/1915/1917 synthase|nr:RluA family pseudouridine synthase [Myxococcales bacterium]
MPQLPQPLPNSAEAPPWLPILYEDNHVLVVNKPAGLLSQADLSGDLDALTAARQYLKQRYQKPGNVYVGLVHRLDRPVAGVLLLARTSKGASRLSEQFRAQRVQRLYRAVVAGEVADDAGALTNRLEKDRRSRKTAVVHSGGKEARLRYRVLARAAGHSLLEVELLTGLPHQIRAQLAHMGHPILGDAKYGAPGHLAAGPGVIALYAHALSFDHPTQPRRLTVEAPPPPHWPWRD